MNTTHRIALPATYMNDHIECAEDFEMWNASIVKYSKNGRLVYMQLTDEQLDDVASRADYYTMSFGLDEEFMSLSRSAKATVRRIAKYRAALDAKATAASTNCEVSA